MPGTLELCRPSGYRKGSRTVRGSRPWSFFVMEELLKARAESQFPTNGAGPDEDVNIYLAHLMTGFLCGPSGAVVQAGAEPLLIPADLERTRSGRANHYRVNADHRLLHLGLMGRGDAIRRRPSAFGMTPVETRARDIAVGRHCYSLAANLLNGRNRANSGLAPVLAKLSEHFEDYVHVVAATAVRRLGLGSKIGTGELARLGQAETKAGAGCGGDPEQGTEDRQAVQDLLSEHLPPGAMDTLLDLALDYRRSPDPVTWARVAFLADRLRIDPQALLPGEGAR